MAVLIGKTLEHHDESYLESSTFFGDTEFCDKMWFNRPMNLQREISYQYELAGKWGLANSVLDS